VKVGEIPLGKSQFRGKKKPGRIKGSHRVKQQRRKERGVAKSRRQSQLGKGVKKPKAKKVHAMLGGGPKKAARGIFF